MATREIKDLFICFEGDVTVRAVKLKSKGSDTSYVSSSKPIILEIFFMLIILYFKVLFGIYLVSVIVHFCINPSTTF